MPNINNHYYRCPPPSFEPSGNGNGPTASCCGGCVSDFNKAIHLAKLAWATSNEKGLCRAGIAFVRPILAIGRAGANLTNIPLITQLMTEIAAAARFAFDQTRLGTATLALNIVGLIFCILDSILACVSISEACQVRKTINFSEKEMNTIDKLIEHLKDPKNKDYYIEEQEIKDITDKLIKHLKDLKKKYFDPTKEEIKDIKKQETRKKQKKRRAEYHQIHYSDFVNAIRPHIAKEVFMVGKDKPHIAKEVFMVGKDKNAMLTDKTIRVLIRGIKRKDEKAILEAKNLLEHIDIQTKKMIFYYCCVLLSYAVTITAISLGFAGYSPTIVISLMATSLFISIINSINWHCLVETSGWQCNPSNLIPSCIRTCCAKVRNCSQKVIPVPAPA